MREFWSQVRIAVRSLRRTPTVAFAAVITLALAVGVSTVIFTAARSVLLRPLPVRDMGELVAIEAGIANMPLQHLGLSPGEVYDLNDRHELFRAVGGFRITAANLTGLGDPRRVSTISTVGPLFDVLGLRPFAGRFYTAEDITHGDKHVAVLSYEFWREITGGDPNSIGRVLNLDGRSYRLIGVLPPSVTYPDRVQIWTPQPPFPSLDARTNYCCRLLTTVGRLRADVTIERARAALGIQMQAWRRRLPAVYAMQSGAGDHPQTITAISLIDVIAGQLRPIVLLLLGATAFLLLVACANIASFQLVRTIGRSREIAVRTALGASRATHASQVAIESLIIGAVGAFVGAIIGAAAVRLIGRSNEWQNAIAANLSFDWRAFAAATIIGLFIAMLAGLVPTLLVSRMDGGDLVQSIAGKTTFGAGKRHLRLAVIAQVALSLTVLLGSALAVRSLDRLVHVDPGFQPEGVMRMRLALSGERYNDNSARLAFAGALLDRLRHVPGVTAVGTVSGGPFSELKPDEASMLVKAIHNGVPAAADARATVWIVGGDYFRAMGIPVQAGRTFSETDNRQSPRVWLVDETLARQLFPGESAIGKHIDWQKPLPTIVGVVGAVKKSDLALPDEPSLYWSYEQYVQPEISVIVRSSLSSAAAGATLRRTVRALDPSLPVFDLMSLEDGIARSIGPRRFAAQVLVAFAIASLALAVLGLYGVLSYSTAQRTREIGIRMALGATSIDAARGVLREAIMVVATGGVLGVALFLVLGRVLASLVFGVGTRDPVSVAIGVAIIAIVAACASLAPALRAASVSPLKALQNE